MVSAARGFDAALARSQVQRPWLCGVSVDDDGTHGDVCAAHGAVLRGSVPAQGTAPKIAGTVVVAYKNLTPTKQLRTKGR